MVDYRGLPGAFVFAFRRSDSHVFRAYAVTGAVLGVVVAVFFLLALVSWVGSAGAFGQSAFLAVLGLLVLLPLVAPVLVVARRHRRSTTDRRADATLGLAGFAVVVSVWLALFVSDPNPHRTTGVLAPALDAIDALPRSAWPVPPLLAVGLLVLSVWLTRPVEADETADDGGDEDAPPPEATIHGAADQDRTER